MCIKEILKESGRKFLKSSFDCQNQLWAIESKFLLQFAAFRLYLAPSERVGPYLPNSRLIKSSAAAVYSGRSDIRVLLKDSGRKFLKLSFD